MAEIIHAIAKAHHLDLTRTGGWVRLTLRPGGQPLVIGVVGQNLVSISQYYVQNGDLCPNRDVVFWTGWSDGWLPVQCVMAIGIRSVSARVEDGVITQIDRAAAADLSMFVDLWANNLREKGWLQAARHADSTAA